jgi:pilus assembly protein CpaB
MSLRLVVLALILTTAAALGLIAYQLAAPAPAAQVRPASEIVPLTVGYLVAARALPAGTLLHDDDIVVKQDNASAVPAGAVRDSADARASLRGALLHRYLDAGMPVKITDVIRSRDRGFLATVLAPGTRAVTIGVDAVTGVAGLIWPGDIVDVILTQEFDQAQTPLTRRVLSETMLTGLRVIAVDQDIVQGGSPTAANAGHLTKTVTLQVTADQAERLTTAQRLGHLALAVDAIGDAPPSEQGAVYGGDVSPALSRIPLPTGSTVQVIEGEHQREVKFQ